MPKFSIASEIQLDTCDERLQRICREAIKYIDFTVVEGHRGQAAQHAAFLKGNSELDWPNGRHNATPSLAVDLAPWPADWSEGEKPHARFAVLAGVMLTCSIQLGISGLIWGGSWNKNWDPRETKFNDWGHFQVPRL